jgi:hypothetical protein
VATPWNRCGDYDEVPRPVCRNDGTAPKGRRTYIKHGLRPSSFHPPMQRATTVKPWKNGE